MSSKTIDQSVTESTKADEKIDRKCTSCEKKDEGDEEEELKISRNGTAISSSADKFGISESAEKEISNTLNHSGSPLDSSTREFMESHFGYDFSDVSIHTGTLATESARSINALAYTKGNNIIFGDGYYRPETNEGRRLLVHELTHVIQQNKPANQIISEVPYSLFVQRQEATFTPAPAAGVFPPSPPVPKGLGGMTARFDGKSIVVTKNGKTQSCPAFTDASAPTPPGRYRIRRQGQAQISGGLKGFFRELVGMGGHSEWYLLEPQFSTTRSRMMIHYGRRSKGCITVTDRDCFLGLATILNGPGVAQGLGYDGYPPGNEYNHKRKTEC